ncbi:MAG TPA: protein kinase [Vicinamibacterales bacterium]|nr:protein kinase [Vicinamibacterales bacterium]
MTLSTGTRLAHYEIISLIGTGGMGAVYKAIDRRLDRTVAIKTLRQSSADLRNRFEREGRVVASLQHPRICTLLDIGVHDGADFIVMEYLDGTKLRCPQPLEKLIEYGTQIADALDAAHRKGIAHRDLKPDNIVVTANGVKLLDFGIAKVIGADTLTDTGMAIGTPAYMAPEQWRGEGSDTRSDIYALGCVLHEMATGQRQWESPAAPPRLDWIIKGCLAANPDERWQSVRDVKRLLQAAGERDVDASSSRAPRRSAAWGLAAVAALGVAATVGSWLLTPASAPPIYQLSIEPPANASFVLASNREGGIAVSPDGRAIAFAARVSGRAQLWVRRFDAAEAQLIAGTDGAFDPFWSPDSQSIGYFTPDRLMRVAAAGGTPQMLCPVGQRPMGGSWGADGVILLTGAAEGDLGIYRIGAGGGAPVNVTAGAWPHFLPDGERFLFSRNNELWTATVSGHDPARKILDATALRPQYSNGHLLYVRGRTLQAQRVDLRTLTVSGDPLPIEELVPGGDANPGEFSATPSGVLAYSTLTRITALVWRGRDGKRLDELASGSELATPRIAPDGRRVAFGRVDSGNTDIWIADLERNTTVRLTFDPAIDRWPIWSPDGRQITYSSGEPQRLDLYRRAADGSGAVERLTSHPSSQHPMDWSSDGRALAFTRNSAVLGTDLMIWPAGGQEYIFLQTKVSEAHSQLDPKTRRWIAYSSDDSGRREIYVQPFVAGQPASDARWQISSDGGTMPRWRADGTELYFWSLDGRLMAASIDGSGTALTWTPPVKLFQAAPPPLRTNDITFDVAANGERFLVVEPAERVGAEPIRLMTNWVAATRSGRR